MSDSTATGRSDGLRTYGIPLRLIRCRWGGWLALSPVGHSLQIGVLSKTEEGARVKFAQSAMAWTDNLARGAEQEPNQS